MGGTEGRKNRDKGLKKWDKGKGNEDGNGINNKKRDKKMDKKINGIKEKAGKGKRKGIQREKQKRDRRKWK